jgi:hypothetical protein
MKDALRKLTVRLTPAQYRDLERLQLKLHLDKNSILRFALTRLAEAEGIVAFPPAKK